MKKIIIILSFCLGTLSSYAQWSQNANNLFTNNKIGIGTRYPLEQFQIGHSPNSENYKLSIPGLYNFEQLRLGQYGNGSLGMELINHYGSMDSYGVKLFASIDDKITGLQIQTADPVTSIHNLKYITRMSILTSGNIGIATTQPKETLQIGEFCNTSNMKLTIPGVYNFEQVRLGQYGNGSSALEFVNHTYTLESYGIRLFSSIDEFQGLQIQTAHPGKSIEDLNYISRLRIGTDGDVSIGSQIHPGKLDVAGIIRAKEVKIEVTGWADYVFDEDYKLPSLEEVRTHIEEYKHLPGIPSEKEVLKEGINIAEMQAKLLQKIEELTLYVIEQDKKLQAQKKEIIILKGQLGI